MLKSSGLVIIFGQSLVSKFAGNNQKGPSLKYEERGLKN